MQVVSNPVNPLASVESAIWEFLNSKTLYTDLLIPPYSLKEYRLYNGSTIPALDPSGLWVTGVKESKLPFIGTEGYQIITPQGRTEGNVPLSIRTRFRIRMALGGHGPGSEDVLAMWTKIQRVLRLGTNSQFSESSGMIQNSTFFWDGVSPASLGGASVESRVTHWLVRFAVEAEVFFMVTDN